ncbi:hypothetical protein HY02_08005 [Peptococcaceae bacterium SCADC1_2_3]|nr:hypothetical protein DK28_0207665 [Peptococcaceae bacterium SCADC1_2_3]KFI37332.1 hypothetical protein HY02_08005 [Peptococcaceae bacterium SCADC1_2_3]HBQ27827.1 hypothetical protein [Desulfotomaculum sp.]HCJ78474.1 hypothetical protein [Desulfotomaculum sp.]
MSRGFWRSAVAAGILGLIAARLLTRPTRQTRKNWLEIVDSSHTKLVKQRLVKELNKIIANLVK